MLFRAATSVAILACATSAAANPQPYMAVMAVPGQSLQRRDTLGYKPEETHCGDGNTCAEACGGGFEQCTSNDSAVHCFNPQAHQTCCSDGSGNSCEDGFYCTHDHKSNTWCCPDSMNLSECAAAYSVKGGLESAISTSTSTSSTSTSTSSTSTSTSTTSTSSTPTTTSTTPTPTSHTTTPKTTTPCANSTVTEVPTTAPMPAPQPPTTENPSPSPEPSNTTGGAAASGVSLALLVAAAGFVTLF